MQNIVYDFPIYFFPSVYFISELDPSLITSSKYYVCSSWAMHKQVIFCHTDNVHMVVHRHLLHFHPNLFYIMIKSYILHIWRKIYKWERYSSHSPQHTKHDITTANTSFLVLLCLADAYIKLIRGVTLKLVHPSLTFPPFP